MPKPPIKKTPPETAAVISGTGVASISRNLAYVMGGRGVYFVTRFLYAVVLARVLGPEIYGKINYGIAAYLLFLPLTKIGLEVILSRDAGLDRQQGERTASLTLTLRIASILVVTAAYIGFSLLFEDDPELRMIVLVFSFALMGRSLAFWTDSVYTAYEVNQYSFRQQSIFRPLEIALGFLALFIWGKALPVVGAHCLAWCLEAAYGLYVIQRGILPLRLIREAGELKRMLLQGLPLAGIMLMSTFLLQGPIIFFRHLGSHGDSLGQLALAMQVFFMLSQIPLALGNVSLPVLSRAAARQDGKDRIYTEIVFRYTVLFGGALALLGMAFGPWVTIGIFGNHYAQGGTLVGAALWLVIPFTTENVLTGVLLARKRDRATFFCTLAGALLFSITITACVERYDTLGAICCAGAAMCLTSGLLIFSLNRYLKLGLWSSLAKPLIMLAGAVGVYLLLEFLNPVTAFSGAIITLVAACFLTGCLTRQDLALLSQPWKSIRR
jgi:O-antigen/teichoic acid export membrane protein